MTRLLIRHLLLLGLAFGMSWWVVFNDPPEVTPHPPQVPDQISIALAPLSQDEAPSPTPARAADAPEATTQPELAPQPEPSPPEPAEDPAPAPSELGSPTSEEDDLPQAASASKQPMEPETPAESAAPDSGSDAEPESLMADTALLAAAEIEVQGRGRKGFSTQLIAAPEDQLEIARTFGEELVLVPYRSVAPEVRDPIWFRISLAGTPSIERVNSKPPLSSYRQYRDLFDYEYSRLPTVLRELRRTVLSRSEVYLFAALIPPREWALVIGRRRQALEQSGRSADDVRTFKIRYRKLADSSFDVEVLEIVFADGSRFRPVVAAAAEASGATTDHHPRNTEKPQ